MAITENNLKITATCSSGLEEILQKEIESFGVNVDSVGKNTVQFYTDMQSLYKLNMATRTATHFFLFLKQFFFKNADEFYAKMKQILWEKHFNVNKLMVDDLFELIGQNKGAYYRSSHLLREKDNKYRFSLLPGSVTMV